MPYRHEATRDEPEQAELRELRDIADASRARTNRVRIVVVLSVLGAVSTLVAGASLRRPRPVYACHEVQIRYENAPEIPPSTYTSCRER